MAWNAGGPVRDLGSPQETTRDRRGHGQRLDLRNRGRSTYELVPKVVNSWSTDPTALGCNQTAVHLLGTRSITGISGQGCTQRYSARRPFSPMVVGSSPTRPITASSATSTRVGRNPISGPMTPDHQAGPDEGIHSPGGDPCPSAPPRRVHHPSREATVGGVASLCERWCTRARRRLVGERRR